LLRARESGIEKEGLQYRDGQLFFASSQYLQRGLDLATVEDLEHGTSGLLQVLVLRQSTARAVIDPFVISNGKIDLTGRHVLQRIDQNAGKGGDPVDMMPKPCLVHWSSCNMP